MYQKFFPQTTLSLLCPSTISRSFRLLLNQIGTKPWLLLLEIPDSAAASGWAGWALAHPEFGSTVNPITTRGTDYAHHITASPPGFENPAAALNYRLMIMKLS